MSNSPPRTKRTLATVLAADAVGFSRHMGENERSAVAAVIECRALMSKIIGNCGGKTIGTPGDFLLAVMPTATDAVESAVKIQEELAERNLKVPEDRRTEYRFGIGIGDVYHSDGDLLGNAVNIAARLQTIAPPGGIVVSGAVRDIVGTHERFLFEYLGDQTLKNLVTPVRAYQVISIASDGGKAAQDAKLRRRARVADRPPLKPVIEIAPFLAKTEDEKLFADALTDELFTILAGLSNSLTVHDFDASRTHPNPDLGEAPRLYRLSGSVRSVGGKIRVSARLTVRDSGKAMWADRLEYQAHQSFDAQEFIAHEVVTAIQVVLTEGEQARLWHKGTASVRAWEFFQRGHDQEQRFTREGHQQARSFYQSAIEQDANYVSAIVELGFCHLDEIRLGWSESVDWSFAEAELLYQRASQIAPEHPDCFALSAFIELHRRNDEVALSAMETAVKLAPRNGQIAACLGYIYETLGRYDDAIEAYNRAILLNFHFPAWIAVNLGFALCVNGRLNEARKTLLGVVQNQPGYTRAYIGLTIVYRRLGLMGDAHQAANEIRRLDPLFSVEAWAQDRPYVDAEIVKDFSADLRAVGLR